MQMHEAWRVERIDRDFVARSELAVAGTYLRQFWFAVNMCE